MCLSNIFKLGQRVNLSASGVYCVKCGATNPAPNQMGVYHGHKYDKSKVGYEHDLFELVKIAYCVACGKSIQYVAYFCPGEVNTAEELAEARKEMADDMTAWIDELERRVVRERVTVRK